MRRDRRSKTCLAAEALRDRLAKPPRPASLEVDNHKLYSRYFHAARSKALREGASLEEASEAGRLAGRRATKRGYRGASAMRLTRGIAGV